MGSIGNGSPKEWATEPIAIVGLSCKFAGDADTPEGFWKMMAEGRNAWSEPPISRWNPKGAYHPDQDKLSTTSVKGAHFLREDVGLFDAAFFSYSGNTAAAVDPQYRLQLESAYEALENAGLPLSKVAGSNTSCYTAIFTHDYHDGLIRDEDNLPRFLPIGTQAAMSSNRISHFFDLRGASFTLDTGCSGGLVALHQAVLGLRAREADMSVVSGCNLMLAADQFKTFSSMGLLSPDGVSYAFDSRANGYGRGEGVGTLVIKRLRDALEAGDPVRAVIRETYLNQDGKTDTITSPSQSAQIELMRECYRRAGLSPTNTQYFEAHGTGTPTGDPIEARSIAAVFGPHTGRTEPLLIGSVKTNIGHTEAASGLAAVIKVVLALEKGQIPPSVNYKKPNPKMQLDEWGLQVATKLEPWPEAGPEARRASINNFGYGGTNSHVILEDATSFLDVLGSTKTATKLTNGRPISNDHGRVHDTKPSKRKSEPFVFSGRDEQSCQRMIAGTKAYLEQQQQSNHSPDYTKLMRDLSFTLNLHRTRFPSGWISTQVVPYTDTDLTQAIQSLDSTGSSAPQLKSVRLETRPQSQPLRIGMVFTGQGAQWHAMARELIGVYPIFRATLDEAERHVKEFGANWSLTEELMMRDASTTLVNTTALSIPICVAVQIALVRLLRTWGIEPAAVTSHSSGEIAAAYAVGALSLRQAMAVGYYRAAFAADMTKRSKGPKGAMVAVGIGKDAAKAYLDKLTSTSGSGKAVVACINSPNSVTIAGDEGAVEQVLSWANEDSVFARRLKVDTGYHSHHMIPIAEPYREALRMALEQEAGKNNSDISTKTLDILFSSPVTGCRITDTKQLARPGHWIDSLLQPVRFVESFTDMIFGEVSESTNSSNSNVDIILEVGPHTALGGPIKEILSLPELEGVDLPYMGCLVRNEDARDCMLTMSLNLLRKGHQVDLAQLSGSSRSLGLHDRPQVLTDLPSYPWNHTIKHWAEARVHQAYRQRDQKPHYLLGMLVPGSNPDAATWRQIVRVSELPWLRDHVVQGAILFPGAGYICLAIQASKQLATFSAENHNMSTPTTGYSLRDVEIHQALVVPDNAAGIEVQTVLRSVSDKIMGARGWREFEILSVTADSRWTQHAKGLIMADVTRMDEDDKITPSLLEESAYTRRIDPENMWASLRRLGLNHGPSFQNTKSITQDGSPQSHVRLGVTTIGVADCDCDTKSEDRHVVHPTTLDSVFIASYAALPAAGASDEGARVPRSIQKLWVSSAMPTQSGHTFTCNTKLGHVSAQSIQANVTVVDGIGAGKAVLEMEGLVCQSLGRSATVGAGQDQNQQQPWTKELATKIEWAPDVLLSIGLPGASQAIKAGISQPMMISPSDEAVLMGLRRVCVYFCHDAMQDLTDADIAKLEWHHVKYYKWMKDTLALAASRSLGSDSDKWIHDSELVRERNMALAEAQSADGELIVRLGPLLLPMLRGEQVPLEVMMQDKLLFKYYANAFRFAPGFVQFTEMLRAVVHKNPRARVLEIGAGTGGATRFALKALGSDAEGGPYVDSWHFTDISSGFFEAARAEFSAHSRFLDMKFDRLDIEQDPAAQGFELESYDIVVACQVLHATKSMARTMSHVRSLMKPGAQLLLMETTQDQIDLQFIYGLLPGWWLSEEPERVSSPSLTTPFWDKILKGAGFTNGIDVELRDYEGCEDMYAISNMLVSVPAPPLTLDDSSSIVIVTSNRAPLPTDWVQHLRECVSTCVEGNPLPVVQTLESSDESFYSGKFCIFVGEIDQPLLASLDDASLKGIKTIATSCKGLLWVTRGGAVECANPQMALINGFLRVIRNEYVGRKFLTLDLDPKQSAWALSDASAIVHVMKETGLGGTAAVAASFTAEESEFALRDGLLLVPRIFKDVSRNKMISPDAVDWSSGASIPEAALYQEDRPLRLHVGMPGMLDSLVFDDDEAYEDYADENTVEIEPRAYGVNFRDVMVALDQLRERVMGVEVAGIITRLGSEAEAQGFAVGDRVMGLLHGPFGSSARIWWQGLAHIPEDMGFEDAASLPVVFATAYECLVNIARLQQGQSVLIHAAAGGVGQAAIMLAKDYLGAEVFVTCGSQEKRELLMREYDLPAERIFNSRDTSFAPGVLAATGGRGVDMVLNSLAGPLLQASFDVLAPFGHMVEIGKRDLEGGSLLNMATFSRVASYTSVDILQTLRDRRSECHRLISEVSRLASQGVIRPIHSVTAYPMDQAAKAFRLLQTGKHMGKIVLSTPPDQQVKVLPRVPKAKLKADVSYLIVGGVGGLGRSTAFWMASHGAKNLIVLSRSAGNVEKNSSLVSGLREAGCRVTALNCDVTDKDDLARALRICDSELPPIRGIVQGAMVLQDSILENMTLNDWQTAIRPKVAATWNLHAHFSQPGSLDFFVMLSSLSGVFGWASQSNYAAGGSYQDALARFRVAQGLPAVSLDLGMVTNVGYVSETSSVSDRLNKVGLSLPLSDEDVLQALGTAILHPLNQPQVLLGLNSGPGAHWNTTSNSPMGRDARFLPLRYRRPIAGAQGQAQQAQDESDANAKPLSAKLQEAGSSDEAEQLLGDAIATKLAEIFMIPTGDIDMTQPPASFGVDSLVAVELRNMLMLKAAADVPVFNILQSVSLAALAVDVVAKSSYVTAKANVEVGVQ